MQFLVYNELGAPLQPLRHYNSFISYIKVRRKDNTLATKFDIFLKKHKNAQNETKKSDAI